MGCRWDDDHCPREPGEPDDDEQDPGGLDMPEMTTPTGCRTCR